jgi:hypothetical protein
MWKSNKECQQFNIFCLPSVDGLMSTKISDEMVKLVIVAIDLLVCIPDS